MTAPFTLSDLESAAAIVGETMAPTPALAWPLLRERAGIEVWVKHENHTPTGAFKVRGGLVYARRLKEQGYRGGLITATRGNHGQSVPFAASRIGVPVTVVVPEGNSAGKNRAMQAWGAELVVHGKDFDEAREEAGRLAATRGLRFTPSFHPDLVCGVATCALELFRAVKDLHTVYVPIGMGSGVCALIGVRDLFGLPTRIVGVVSAHAPAYALSVAQGRVVKTSEARTFADGMACRVPDPQALDIIRAGVERILLVTDDEVANAMRVYFEDTRNVAEGAGAAALAALLQDRDNGLLEGERAGVILTGGNVDSGIFAEVLSGSTPRV